MGAPGSKNTEDAAAVSAALMERLAPLGEVSRRGMFGGYGLFVPAGMFALVTSAGIPHLKTSTDSATDYEDAGSERFSRMPYHSIPMAVLEDDATLLQWAREAAARASSRTKQ